MKNKRWILLIIVGLLLVPLNFYLVPNASAAWWDSDWDYYKTITIESDYIDADLTYFPVLVNSTNATLIALCQANGEDVVFTSMDNVTVFAHEIEEWNPGGFTIHVNISETLTSGSDYQFLMYYGNAGASDNQNPTGVWDSDYISVWHMNSSSDSTVYDSTSNDYDSSTNSFDSVSAVVGQGADFVSGNSDYLSFGDMLQPADGSLKTITFDFWVKVDDVSVFSFFMSKYDGDTPDRPYYVTSLDPGKLRAFAWQDVSHVYWYTTDNQVFTNNNWYYGTVVLDIAGGNLMTFYINGTSVAATKGNTGVVGNLQQCAVPDTLARYAPSGADTYTDAVFDEIRYSNVMRNSSWVKSSFHSQNQSSHLGDFLTWGAEQDKPPGVNPPVVSNEYPADGSVYVCPNSVELGITVSDLDGDLMNITFWSNLSGVWDYFYLGTINRTLVDVADGTYFINPVYFVRYNHVYYWNVSVTDGTNIVDSGVFSFTTSSSPCGKGGGGGGISSNGSAMALGAGGMMFAMLAIVMKRRKRRNDRYE